MLSAVILSSLLLYARRDSSCTPKMSPLVYFTENVAFGKIFLRKSFFRKMTKLFGIWLKSDDKKRTEKYIFVVQKRRSNLIFLDTHVLFGPSDLRMSSQVTAHGHRDLGPWP